MIRYECLICNIRYLTQVEAERCNHTLQPIQSPYIVTHDPLPQERNN